MYKPLKKLYINKGIIMALVMAVMILVQFIGAYSTLSKGEKLYNYARKNTMSEDSYYEYMNYHNFYNIMSYETLSSDRDFYEVKRSIYTGIVSDFTEKGILYIFIITIIMLIMTAMFSGRKNAQFLAVLPYKKHIHYIYRYISGLIPGITAFMFLAILQYVLEASFDVYHISYMRLINFILVAFLTYSLLNALSRLFGNPIYCCIMCVLACLGGKGLFWGLGEFLGECFGVHSPVYETYHNFLYWSNHGRVHFFNESGQYKISLLIIIGIIITFILGLLLDKKYTVEKTSLIFAYKWLEYIVYIVGGIMGGFSFYYLIILTAGKELTVLGGLLVIAMGIAITVFSVHKLNNMIENGGESGALISFNKTRI